MDFDGDRFLWVDRFVGFFQFGSLIDVLRDYAVRRVTSRTIWNPQRHTSDHVLRQLARGVRGKLDGLNLLQNQTTVRNKFYGDELYFLYHSDATARRQRVTSFFSTCVCGFNDGSSPNLAIPLTRRLTNVELAHTSSMYMLYLPCVLQR